MAYASITKPSLHFNTKLYTGTGAENAQTGVGFQPDFTWIKDRDSTNWHRIIDVVRGVTKEIYPNDTAKEATHAQSLKSFDSDGFTLGTLAEVNASGNDFVSWNWKCGGATSSNSDGSITSNVTANTTSGVSVVTWTGNQTNSTVGHGLGVAPDVIFVKNYGDASGAENWRVGHSAVSSSFASGVYLNDQSTSWTQTGVFNDTAPTSSVFTVGTFHSSNGTGDGMVAYCFSEKKGFSKFGTYTGNASTDGPFIYTGFKPAWVVVKTVTTQAGHWRLADNKRTPFNTTQNLLFPSNNGAENTTATGNGNDYEFFSNGFKITTDNAYANGNGNTLLYMAFAAEPLVANVGQSIPATAR